MAKEAFLHKVNPYDLHGVRWYQMFLSFADAPGSVREVRLSHDAVYQDPADGDTVLVEQILSMITEVKKKPA